MRASIGQEEYNVGVERNIRSFVNDVTNRLALPIRWGPSTRPTPSEKLHARRQRMCRNIKTLRRTDDPATEDEIRAAARQYVRKISGHRRPSRANQLAFEAAIDEVARASRNLLENLVVKA
jgi:hypothetical protein